MDGSEVVGEIVADEGRERSIAAGKIAVPRREGTCGEGERVRLTQRGRNPIFAVVLTNE
jgi:hypothetical protein